MQKGEIMSAGHLITSFKPEVQMKILSNQDKYNPDKNEYIDSNEIGELLKEYKSINIADLQKEKSALGKIGGYLMPTSDVYPVEQGGYKVKYTAGAEDFYASQKEYVDRQGVVKPGNPNGKSFLGWLGAIGAGAVGLYSLPLLADGMPKSIRVIAGLAVAALAYVSKRCFNSINNDRNNLAKMTQIDNDKVLQEEKRKREEEQRAADLEFKERLNAATSGIEQNLSNSNNKASNLNNKLNKANKQVDELLDRKVEE